MTRHLEEQVTMPNNDGQPGSIRDLPATRSAAPPNPTEVVRPNTTFRQEIPPQLDLAEETRSRHSQRSADNLLIRANYRMQDRVRHPDGGRSSVEEILQLEKEARVHIEDETRRGSLKHHRFSRVVGWIPILVLVLDFCILLYFMAGVTNVNWAAPLSVALAFALVLASMVTSLTYGFLVFTGHRMRTHKNHAGTVHLDDLDGFTKTAFGSAISLITALALLMFIRMRTEVLNALGPQAGITALVIPLSLAVVSAMANYMVVAIHALDGSDQVARLNKLSAAGRRSFTKAQRMRERAAMYPRPLSPVRCSSTSMPWLSAAIRLRYVGLSAGPGTYPSTPTQNRAERA